MSSVHGWRQPPKRHTRQAHIVWAAEAPGAVRRKEALLTFADSIGARAPSGAVERASPVAGHDGHQCEQAIAHHRIRPVGWGGGGRGGAKGGAKNGGRQARKQTLTNKTAFARSQCSYLTEDKRASLHPVVEERQVARHTTLIAESGAHPGERGTRALQLQLYTLQARGGALLGQQQTAMVNAPTPQSPRLSHAQPSASRRRRRLPSELPAHPLEPPPSSTAPRPRHWLHAPPRMPLGCPLLTCASCASTAARRRRRRR